VYELPFGSRRAFFADAPKAMRPLISGWQISAVMNQWSGNPLSFGDVILKSNDIAIANPKVERWFNTAAFETAPARQLAFHRFQGPLYYSGVRSDGVHQWDISVLKYTQLRENVKLQFRAEAFNVFNHPEFSAPNTAVTSAAFGTVTGENVFTRQIQFGMRLVF
jgi:hypothetical protein